MIRRLAALADSLDQKGFYKEASQIDRLIIFARVEEFQEDLELFRTSFLLQDPTTRSVIERLLDLYNKVGSQARKDNESTRPRLSVPTEEELMIPQSSLDPAVAKESLMILLESAKMQIKHRLQEGLQFGHWNAVAIKTYINKIDQGFDLLVKRKTEPIESVVLDFLDMVFSILSYTSNMDDVREILEKRKNEKRDIKFKESFLGHLKEDLETLVHRLPQMYDDMIRDNPSYSQIVTAEKEGFMNRLTPLMDAGDIEGARKVAQEVYKRKGHTKYWKELFPTLKF